MLPTAPMKRASSIGSAGASASASSSSSSSPAATARSRARFPALEPGSSPRPTRRRLASPRRSSPVLRFVLRPLPRPTPTRSARASTWCTPAPECSKPRRRRKSENQSARLSARCPACEKWACASRMSGISNTASSPPAPLPAAAGVVAAVRTLDARAADGAAVVGSPAAARAAAIAAAGSRAASMPPMPPPSAPPRAPRCAVGCVRTGGGVGVGARAAAENANGACAMACSPVSATSRTRGEHHMRSNFASAPSEPDATSPSGCWRSGRRQRRTSTPTASSTARTAAAEASSPADIGGGGGGVEPSTRSGLVRAWLRRLAEDQPRCVCVCVCG
mmetsp:Transcript_43807/g.108389  ORF Transcript_43807/g.108389 Transcript_43807/m.108389 type:complete len:334 (+) Transcript_43807:253-1254(+)